MNLDEALKTFIIESRELLESMEASLLRIEQEPNDPDIINAIFRAAHTIKGSAGLFGLDYIVSFTHVAESVLDKVRSGELNIDADLAALLLDTSDHMGALVNHAANGEEPGNASNQRSQELIVLLNKYLGVKTAVAVIKEEAKQASVPVEFEHKFERDGGEVETDNWHISLRFGKDVFRNGMDPLSFIRYLATLGRIVHIVTLTDAVPSIKELDPESCYLGFEIAFKSEVDKSVIEGVFEFVREDCMIRILPPRSKISEYLGLIRDMDGENLRLGDILVSCGTLTDAELDNALRIQAGGGNASRPIGEVLVEQSMVSAPVVEAALEKQKQAKDKEAKSNEVSLIRVDSEKLDQLINLVGELIIAGAGTTLIAQRAGMPELVEATATLSRMVEEVRDSALSLRMVQIGGTFTRFQRVVRDVSRDLGKDIRLEIHGAETELDKTVVEKIGDPLTHLVRNSMDHGIEPAEVRLARGKPAHGTLKLNAYHDSGSIVIEVTDDGGGLNRDKILAKAIERGLVKPDQQLSDKEIYNLIFEAGFSTADTVSNLSGRGVGMDVVRRNIQALRGTVDIESEIGKGSTMRIRLPLTLAIIDGFMVGVGSSAYVVPLDMVIECIELPAGKKTEGNYLNLRGEVLPYVRLRDLFEVEGDAGRRENVVVVQYAGHKAGLVVDNLLGEYQTVIKPLGKVFGSARGFGGFTIMGSGEVALILDVPRLMQQVSNSREVSAAGQ
ncbi:MAG: chemotaxis protein CheA [Gallionellaceae bacterium]|jgi:two-component system chemotaxis sensor kinase CheA